MINNIEKIEIVQSKINMMNLHVSALLDDISREPLGDNPEKPTRQSVLNDIISVIDVLEIEKLALTNQG